jgi:hypothetical protein
MSRFIVELRNAWGRQVYAVLDATHSLRTVARCDTHADAANVCSALNAREAEVREVLKP